MKKITGVLAFFIILTAISGCESQPDDNISRTNYADPDFVITTAAPLEPPQMTLPVSETSEESKKKDRSELYKELLKSDDETVQEKRSESLDEFRMKIREYGSDHIAGVAYIKGTSEQIKDTSDLSEYFKDYPFLSELSDIKIIDTVENNYSDAGVYCIIPYDSSVSVCVKNKNTKNTFYNSESGDPVIIVCSNLSGNTEISVSCRSAFALFYPEYSEASGLYLSATGTLCDVSAGKKAVKKETDEEKIKRIISNYYISEHDQLPEATEITQNDDGTWDVHLYDGKEDYIISAARYTVSQDITVAYDDYTGEEIDLTLFSETDNISPAVTDQEQQ